MATSYLLVKSSAIARMDDPASALPFARIESHYFVNNSFFPTTNWILENISKIKNIQGSIIQGRYDIVCPAKSAWELKKSWPKAELNIVPDAGHSASEPGIRSALIDTTDRFRTI